MHSDLCTTSERHGNRPVHWIQYSFSFLIHKSINRTVINISPRAPPSRVVQNSLHWTEAGNLYLRAPLPGSYRSGQMSLHLPPTLLVLEVFCMYVSIGDLLWTSQISIRFERNLYSLLPCINSFTLPQKMHFIFCRTLHLHGYQFILY